MKILKKKNFLSVFLIIFIIIFIGINYFISVRIKKDIFYKSFIESSSFASSYDSISISNKSITFKLYKMQSSPEKPTLFYFPSKNGPLNHVINSLLLHYNIYTIEYPPETQYQTPEKLTEILETSLRYLQENFTIKPSEITLFGHEIGANIIFNFSTKESFQDILLFNELPSPSFYCKKSFYKVFCLMTKRGLFNQGFSPNNIYVFFNENNFTTPEERYQIFNKIHSTDKFFFEIPGSNLDFNFNHILDFYNNENLMQNEKLNDKRETTNEDEALEGSEETYILDADGLLNDEKYID